MPLDDDVWKIVIYLTTLLISTVISVFGVRRYLEDKINEDIKVFTKRVPQQNRLIDSFLLSNTRLYEKSKESVISSLLPWKIGKAKDDAGRDIEKYVRLTEVKCILKWLIDCPLMVTFALFLSILFVYFFLGYADFCSWQSFVCMMPLLFLFLFIPFCISFYLSPPKMHILWVIGIGFLEFFCLGAGLYTPLLAYSNTSCKLPLWILLPVPIILGIVLLIFFYLNRPRDVDIQFFSSWLKRTHILALVVYLLFFFALHFRMNIPTNKLFFRLFPMDIAIYFMIVTVVFYFFAYTRVNSQLDKVLNFIGLLKLHGRLPEKKRMERLDRLQLFCASGLQGLLLSKELSGNNTGANDGGVQ